MATFRNDSGDDLTIDRFGLYVPAGATFEIPDVDADSITDHLAIVRVASDVPAEIALPDEVIRDLVEVAGYTPADLDAAAAEAAPVPDPAADVPSEPSVVAPSAATATEAAVEPTPAVLEPTPAEDEPAADEEPAVDEEPAAGDLDSFTQS